MTDDRSTHTVYIKVLHSHKVFFCFHCKKKEWFQCEYDEETCLWKTVVNIIELKIESAKYYWEYFIVIVLNVSGTLPKVSTNDSMNLCMH